MKSTAYTLLVTFSLLVSSVRAQSVLIDDFNNGSDDGWSHADLSSGQPWGPGIFDASSGSYHLASTGVLALPHPQGILNSLWDASSEPLFSHGILRATLRAENGGTVPGLLVRYAPGAFPFLDTGYVFGMDARINEFFVLTLGTNESHRFTVADFEIQAGQDWIMEAGAVGDQITMKAWPVGQPEPPVPQLRLTDSSHSTGLLGVTSAVSFRAQEPWRNSATFDDIIFTPQRRFLRGDCNADGTIDVSDAICLLNWLFRGGEAPGCLAAANANGNEDADISDASYLLRHLVLGGSPPAAPFPECGPTDPGADEGLGCKSPPAHCP